MMATMICNQNNYEVNSFIKIFVQPLTGPNGNRRCKEDERFLNHSLPRNSRRGYVIDTRNANAVKAAQTKGGGIEPEAHYPQWKRIYCGMERPQVNDFQC